VRKSVIAVAVVVVLAGAVVAAVPVLEKYAARQVKIGIERDGATKVGEVDVSFFERRMTLRDVRSTGSSDFVVGRWEASGVAWPLGELLRGRTPLAGFRWGDPLRAERVELQGLRVVDRAAASSWSMESLAIDGLDLARFDAKYDGAYQFQVLLARAMAALSMRRLEERNVVFAVPGTGDTFGMASIVLERYEQGRIASMTMTGVEAVEKEGQAPLYSIADIKSDGIDMSRVIAAMSSDQWYPGAPVGRVHVENASATGFAGETLKRYGISLGSVGLATVREADRRSRSTVRIEGFVLAPSLRGLEGLQVRLALQTMGLKDVKADFDCTFSEDRAKGEASLDRCALVGPGLGEIDLSGRIVGADQVFWHALDEGDTLGLQDSQAALASARLVLADKSLLERGLKALATVTGQPVATTRANMARDIRRYQPSGVLISQSMTQLLDTVARFVEQGGTLTIAATPDPPVAFDKFDYLTSPGADLVSVLGLSATLSR
jgi:hypothetical protein